MNESKHYISLMIESLEKKSDILTQLVVQNANQAVCIEKEQSEGEAFADSMKEKDRLIQKLIKLDDGFENLYDRVKDLLTKDKERYRSEIQRMQQLIEEITDKSLSVQAGEERNRRALEIQYSGYRTKMRQSMVATKAAADYYKNVNKVNYIDPQFMDRKK